MPEKFTSPEAKMSPEEKMYGMIDKMRMNRTSMLARKAEKEKIDEQIESLLASSEETGEEMVNTIMELEDLRQKRYQTVSEIRKMSLENAALHNSVEDLKEKVSEPQKKEEVFTEQEEEWFEQGDKIGEDIRQSALKVIREAKAGKIKPEEISLPVNEEEIDAWLEQPAA